MASIEDKQTPSESQLFDTARIEAVRLIIEARLKDPKTPVDDLEMLRGEIVKLNEQRERLAQGLPLELAEPISPTIVEGPDFVSAEVQALNAKLMDPGTTLEELQTIQSHITKLE